VLLILVRVQSTDPGEGRLLGQSYQKANDNRKQSYPFYESCCNDHVCTKVTDAFRLTGHSVESVATNETYSDTCSDCCKTGTDTSKTFAADASKRTVNNSM
jgi:hypothetical protein